MEIKGEYRIGASREKVFAALNDQAILQACIPGCEKFVLTEPNVYAVTTAIKTLDPQAQVRIDRTQNLVEVNTEQPREALAAASPIDPDSGMATPQYMEIHGAQLLSAAVRQRGEQLTLTLRLCVHTRWATKPTR